MNDALHTSFRENGATVTGGSVGDTFVKVDAGGLRLHLLPEEITLEKPVAKSWAEEAKVREVFVTKSGDRVTRIFTKMGENRWLLQYPEGAKGYSDWSDENVAGYTGIKV